MTQLYTGKVKVGNRVVWFGGDFISSAESIDDLEPNVPTLLPPSEYDDVVSAQEQEEQSNEPSE